MAASPTLADLRVMMPFGTVRPDGVTVNRINGEPRPATREDILTVLFGLRDTYQRHLGPKTVGEYQLGKPGVYLIIPIEES